MPILSCHNLTKSFDSFLAVDHVSITFQEKEIVGIIGPNGAGKTTLLNLLSGHLLCDSGNIKIGEEDITGKSMDTVARQGFIRSFQRPRAVGELTVMDNMLLAHRNQKGETFLSSLRRNGWRSQESSLTGQASRLLKEIGIFEKKDYLVADISFGQMKLLTLGMILFAKPIIAGLDEPVAGVAFGVREEIKRILQTMKSVFPIIIIEHDFEFLLQIADRILLMAEGKVLLDGSPDKVLNSNVTLDAFSG